MKKYKYIVFFITAILFVSCNENQNLGDDYYFLPDYVAYDVGYPGGAIIYKSPEKYYYKKIVVKGNVKAVHHNRKYIIASQKLLDVETQTEDTTFNYFIIDKENDSVYGPLSWENYLDTKKALEVNVFLRFGAE